MAQGRAESIAEGNPEGWTPDGCSEFENVYPERLYFGYSRSLLGKLCQAAYGTVCDLYGLEPDAGNGVPAMVAAVQSSGDLLNFNPHVHSVVGEGVFLDTGQFVGLPDAQMHRAEEFWRERVFALLLDSHKIDEPTRPESSGQLHA